MGQKIAALALLSLATAGCSGRDFARDDRGTSDLESHFKKAGYEAEVRAENGPYPGGSIARWTLKVPASKDRQLTFGVFGEVWKFMYPSMAQDYAHAVERPGPHGVQAAVSGVYVLIVNISGFGLHEQDHEGVRTPGLVDAHKRYIEIQADYKKVPKGEIPWERVLEALRAEQPYLDQESALCRKDVFAIFTSFGR